LPAAVVGVLVFLYGVITMNYNQVALEVCTEGHKFVMCPLCGECDDWTLSDICVYKKVAYLFDHPGTVFYAIFMSFWGKVLTYLLKIFLKRNFDLRITYCTILNLFAPKL